MTNARKLLLAAAALVTLGTAALSSNEASAYGFRYGGYNHYHYGFHHWGFHHWGFRHYGFHRFYNYSYRWHYQWAHRTVWPPSYWRPRVISAPVVERPTYSYAAAPVQIERPTYAAAPIAPRPRCIIKQYTQEGAVVFTDRCTQETAMNPPAEINPVADQQPAAQAPQQQDQGLQPPYAR